MRQVPDLDVHGLDRVQKAGPRLVELPRWIVHRSIIAGAKRPRGGSRARSGGTRRAPRRRATTEISGRHAPSCCSRRLRPGSASRRRRTQPPARPCQPVDPRRGRLRAVRPRRRRVVVQRDRIALRATQRARHDRYSRSANGRRYSAATRSSPRRCSNVSRTTPRSSRRAARASRCDDAASRRMRSPGPRSRLTLAEWRYGRCRRRARARAPRRRSRPAARSGRAASQSRSRRPPDILDGMATEAELLDAICAAPELDEPRLVYAGWLEERGDLRGEFIRASCTPEGGARAQELLARHGERWASALGGLAAELSHPPLFERGFVAELYLMGTSASSYSLRRDHRHDAPRAGGGDIGRGARTLACGQERVRSAITSTERDRRRLTP